MVKITEQVKKDVEKVSENGVVFVISLIPLHRNYVINESLPVWKRI